MRSSPIHLPGIVLGLLLAPLAIAQSPEEEVRAFAQEWVEGMGRGDPDFMVSLYAEDAILHGTTSPVLRRGHALIREYFAAGAAAAPRMFFIEPMHIRVFGDTAVNTGNYGVRFQPQQQAVTLRYSFVYHRFADGWKIVDHHSSRLPE